LVVRNFIIEREGNSREERYERRIRDRRGVVVFGGAVVSMLIIGPKVCGFRPCRWRQIFEGDKNLEHAFLWSESKAVGLML
jgi:hypothetical protein